MNHQRIQTVTVIRCIQCNHYPSSAYKEAYKAFLFWFHIHWITFMGFTIRLSSHPQHHDLRLFIISSQLKATDTITITVIILSAMNHYWQAFCLLSWHFPWSQETNHTSTTGEIRMKCSRVQTDAEPAMKYQRIIIQRSVCSWHVGSLMCATRTRQGSYWWNPQAIWHLRRPSDSLAHPTGAGLPAPFSNEVLENPAPLIIVNQQENFAANH